MKAYGNRGNRKQNRKIREREQRGGEEVEKNEGKKGEERMKKGKGKDQ